MLPKYLKDNNTNTTSIAMENIQIQSLEDKESSMLDTNSFCKDEKLSIIDPATWTDNNMTQQIRAEVVKFGREGF